MLAWSTQHGPAINSYRPERLQGLKNPRQWEVSRALIQVARIAKCEDSVAKALVKIMARESADTQSAEQTMLAMIREEFDKRDTQKLTTETLLAAIGVDKRFAGMSGHALGAKLRGFGVQPSTIRLNAKEAALQNTKPGTPRGYTRRSFEEAWERYL
jgi:hypothetical protein